jgi:hypothetical protein
VAGTFASLEVDGARRALRLAGCAIGSTLSVTVPRGITLSAQGAKPTAARPAGEGEAIAFSVEAADVAFASPGS